MDKKQLTELGKVWMDRIEQATKREKAWSDIAERAEAAYTAGTCEDGNEQVPDWNIVASNVETIVPSTYNSTPQPDIRSRHDTKDVAVEHASDMFERALITAIDDGVLDKEMEAVAQDAFLAGRGIIRVSMNADIQQLSEHDPETDEVINADAGMTVANESLIYECVPWRDYREGPAKRWRDVPWVAYASWVSQEEIDDLEDEEIKKAREDDDAEKEEVDERIWQIWDKAKRQVITVTEKRQRVISIKDDPLGLSGFFPQGEPVQPMSATGSRLPVCPYAIYEKQAEELNRVTKRINALVRALKAKGAVMGAAGSIEDFAQADDNTLTPMADLEAIAAMGGLEKAIAWWPIDKIIAVIRELYAAREQIKAAIYEITGISDIIRGQGAASETATAQQIKTEWGHLRIKKMQRLIERQVRSVFVLSTEIMARWFPPEQIAKMAGLPLEPKQDPTAVQSVVQILSSPLDHYRIDVESDSTVKADTAQRREEMARFLEGTAQFFATMAPLVAQGPQSAAPIAKIFGAFTTQFNLGKQAEDAIDELVALAEQMAQNPPPNPEEDGKKMEVEARQAEMQARSQELQMKAQTDQAKAGADMQKMQMEMQIQQQEAQLEREKMNLEREKLMLEREKIKLEYARLQAPEPKAA